MHPDLGRVLAGDWEPDQSCFLEGPVGAGKREALGARLQQLLASGVPGYSVLVLLPDRSAREQYQVPISRFDLGPFGAVELNTYYSLAGRLVRLFWPLVAADAGFASPQRPPVFLTYETAQYLMGELIAPFLGQGYLDRKSTRLNSSHRL